MDSLLQTQSMVQFPHRLPRQVMLHYSINPLISVDIDKLISWSISSSYLVFVLSDPKCHWKGQWPTLRWRWNSLESSQAMRRRMSISWSGIWFSSCHVTVPPSSVNCETCDTSLAISHSKLPSSSPRQPECEGEPCQRSAIERCCYTTSQPLSPPLHDGNQSGWGDSAVRTGQYVFCSSHRRCIYRMIVHRWGVISPRYRWRCERVDVLVVRQVTVQLSYQIHYHGSLWPCRGHGNCPW